MPRAYIGGRVSPSPVKRIEGIYCPTVTFYDAAGHVDVKAFQKHVRNLVDAGLQGVVPMGTMGEFTLLSGDERRTLAQAAVEAVNGKGKVLVATGSPSTEVAVGLSRHAQEIGADGVVVVSPFYLKPNREGLRKHYEALHRAVDLPLLAYNLPSFTGYSLENDLVVELAREGILQGLKDTEGNLAKDLALLADLPKDFSLLTGADPICLALTVQGGAGGILGTSNFFPMTVAEMYTRIKEGDLQRAAEIQAGVVQLSEAIGTGPFPAATKYVVQRIWGFPSTLRLPVTGLSEAERIRVDTILKPFLGTWK